MSDQWDDQNDDNQQDQQQGGKGLRAQLEAALAANRAQAEELSKLRAAARTQAVSDVLKAKNYPAKVAKLIPKDVEPTEEAVTAWLDEYGDLFGVAKQQATVDTATEAAPEDEPMDDAAMAYIQMSRQMGNVTAGAMTPDKQKDLLAQINDPAMTRDKLVALIEQQGGGTGTG